MKTRGAIAAGHTETAAAAATVLEEGGNAFDAAMAGLCAACMVEPGLTSLGGGGFLLARPAGGAAAMYDFFAHTPKARRAGVDFFPVLCDFGAAQQEFHIGMGSIATPGTVKGLFAVHAELCSMPMARIVEPAVALARTGVRIDRLQAFIFEVVGNIFTANAACRAVFGSPTRAGQLIGEGEIFANPALAGTLEALAREGEELFYRGEIARRIVADCAAGGGLLTMADLEGYRVEKRRALGVAYRGARLFTNPPPSTGGILIAFALELLKGCRPGSLGFGSAAHLELLARIMELTNRARVESRLHEADEAAATDALLDAGFLETYRAQVLGRPAARRGTTHLSVLDAAGNAASLSLSNGEGSGYLVPDSGVVLNNMLGEEDINPHGLQKWPEDTRMSSMMAPTLIEQPGGVTAVLGSGGSNRIRTAILQVISNLLDFQMPLKEAVESPRIHFEDGLLNIEDGYHPPVAAALAETFPENRIWDEKNLFFGGVHVVRFNPGRGDFAGAGDPRRGGVARIV